MDENDVLTTELEGAVAQYDDSLLFIGFDLDGEQVQIMVYPNYRFPGDDRVHGQIGILDVPWGTRWSAILQQVDAVAAQAMRNYRRCAAMRAAGGRGRAGGRSTASAGAYDRGPDHIGEQFRESWAAISLRLAREGCVVRGDVTFTGDPHAPFLATWHDQPYTVRVYNTGSVLVVPGDQRADLLRREGVIG